MKPKFLLSLLIVIGSSLAFFFFARAPKTILNSNTQKTRTQFGKKKYVLSNKQFQFLLKKGEIVRFVITPPYYGIKTAIGIASDGTAEKMKILVYKLSNKQDQEGDLIDATMDKEDYVFWELESKAHYFMIEIRMLASSGGDLGSYVELIHGFQEPEKQGKETEFIYHTKEWEKPTGRQAPPCSAPERHFLCTPSEPGYVHTLDKDW
jgi:hypothetical protein